MKEETLQLKPQKFQRDYKGLLNYAQLYTYWTTYKNTFLKHTSHKD